MDVHGYPCISMDIHGFPWISMGYVYPGRGKCLSYKGSLRGGGPSYFPGEGGSGGERAGALCPAAGIKPFIPLIEP